MLNLLAKLHLLPLFTYTALMGTVFLCWSENNHFQANLGGGILLGYAVLRWCWPLVRRFIKWRKLKRAGW